MADKSDGLSFGLNLARAMFEPLFGTITWMAEKIEASEKSKDRLVNDILVSQSVHIVGYFLDTERCDDIEYKYREAAFLAAMRLINNYETDSEDKEYLQGLINNIEENEDDDLQEEAKEQVMSCAEDSELSEIALDDDEDTTVRLNAVKIITDTDILLDIATDADEEDIRQAAKERIKELR